MTANPLKIVGAFAAVIATFWVIHQVTAAEQPSYVALVTISEVTSLAEAKSIAAIDIDLRENGLAQIDARTTDGRRLRTLGLIDRAWLEQLDRAEVHYAFRAANGFWESLLIDWTPSVFLFAIFVFFVRRIERARITAAGSSPPAQG
jgi:hypothetical protein